VGALRKRVNTRIRSSRAVNANALATDLMERAVELVLSCIAMCLALPAGEGRPVVSNG
jgi:hypothetical protein